MSLRRDFDLGDGARLDVGDLLVAQVDRGFFGTSDRALASTINTSSWSYLALRRRDPVGRELACRYAERAAVPMDGSSSA